MCLCGYLCVSVTVCVCVCGIYLECVRVSLCVCVSLCVYECVCMHVPGGCGRYGREGVLCAQLAKGLLS